MYIVSELINCQPLSKWRGDYDRLPPRRVATLCRKIALALHEAHEAGVIHRDVKPQNVLIDDAGEPHLTDFGLARRVSGEVTATLDGQIVGTPACMSPEQARGGGHHADRTTDIYSLGVILFELLTGRLPFEGSPSVLLQQVAEREPPRLRELDGNVPRDLETICLKCLEKEPSCRYATAAEVAEELDRFLRGEPVRARPITRAARLWRKCRKNPLVAGLSVAAASLAVLLLAAVVSLRVPPLPEIRSLAVLPFANKTGDPRKLTLEEQAKLFDRGTANDTAYALFEVGRLHIAKRTTAGFLEAIKYLEQAIEADERYAYAYTELAQSYLCLAMYDMPSDEMLPKAKQAALKALEIDPMVAQGYLVLGFVRLAFDRSRDHRDIELVHAIQLDPRVMGLHGIGRSSSATRHHTPIGCGDGRSPRSTAFRRPFATCKPPGSSRTNGRT